MNLPASPCSFNYLQISVKVKWLNIYKKNPWRRNEILFEKKPSLHKKVLSIYREVLSVTSPNFAVVKYNSKVSNIYHQIKNKFYIFLNFVMNRSSIKKLLLKISQYSQ